MPDSVASVAKKVREDAEKVGLVIAEGALSHGNLPVLRWTGNCTDFLKLAKAAGARLLYLDRVTYHARETVLSSVTESLDDFTLPPLERDDLDLIDRLHEQASAAVAPWNDREGEAARLVCTWVVEGVAHVWKAEERWYIDCRKALEQAIDDVFDADSAAASTVT
jgi:hypothetical protein